MMSARALAILLVAAGLYAAAEAWWRMPLGTPGAPGPGMLPLALGLLLVALSGATLLQGAPETEAFARGRAAFVAALLVLYPLLLPRAGFALTTTLVLLLLGRTIAPVAPARLVLFALVSAGVAVLLFRHLLAVPLPRGPWGF